MELNHFAGGAYAMNPPLATLPPLHHCRYYFHKPATTHSYFHRQNSLKVGQPRIFFTSVLLLKMWSQLLVTLQARLSRWIYSPPHLFSGIRCDKDRQTHSSILGKHRSNLPQFSLYAFLTSSANVELSRSIRKFPRALPYYYIIVKN